MTRRLSRRWQVGLPIASLALLGVAVAAQVAKPGPDYWWAPGSGRTCPAFCA